MIRVMPDTPVPAVEGDDGGGIGLHSSHQERTCSPRRKARPPMTDTDDNRPGEEILPQTTRWARLHLGNGRPRLLSAAHRASSDGKRLLTQI